MKEIREVLHEGIEDGVLPAGLRHIIVVSTKWESILGEELSKHARPYRVVGDTLFVGVDSSVWLQELLFVKEGLKAELERLTNGNIKETRFKIKDKV